MNCERYAIWWVPRPGTGLAEFGAGWTGWCADEPLGHAHRAPASLPPPGAGGASDVRRTGLHAPLATPFRLAEGRSAWALEGALADLAGRTGPLVLPRLRAAISDGCVELVPCRPDEALAELMAGIAGAVRPFGVASTFGAVVGEGKVAAGGIILPDKPEPAPRTVRVPVRFRMQLTDPVDDPSRIAAELGADLAPLLAKPTTLTDIALIGDPGNGRPWRLLERFDLEGEASAGDGWIPDGMACIGPSLLAPSLV